MSRRCLVLVSMVVVVGVSERVDDDGGGVAGGVGLETKNGEGEFRRGFLAGGSVNWNLSEEMGNEGIGKPGMG